MSISRRAGAFGALLLSMTLGGCMVGMLDVDVGDHGRNEEATELLTRTVVTTGQSGLTITGANGHIHILGVAGTDVVSIRATKRVRSSDIQDARDGLAEIRVIVETTPVGVRVRTDQPVDGSKRDYIVDYEITVPADFAVTGVNGNGDFVLDDLRGDVDLQGGNGNVTLRNVTRSVQVALGNGVLDASVVLPDDGHVVLSVGNGTLVLHTQPEVSAELRARTGNGTITVSGLSVGNSAWGPGRFDGTLSTRSVSKPDRSSRSVARAVGSPTTFGTATELSLNRPKAMSATRARATSAGMKTTATSG